MNNTEEKRLEIVHLFEQFDFSNNQELNDLVTLAVETCNVPVALITIMGENIQWIKNHSGINITETTREDSFCKYLINTKEVMVVPDALLDERFTDNPAVVDGRVRFYAGAPLITSKGFHLGSFCVIDDKPQQFKPKQKEMLAIISRQVIHMMELQMGLNSVKQHNVELTAEKEKTIASERKLRAFFNGSPSCHVLLDEKLNVVDFNRASEQHIKATYHKQIMNGADMLQFVNTAYRDEFKYHAERAFTGNRMHKEVLIQNTSNGPMWWDVTFEPVKNELGSIVNVAYSASNISEQKMQTAKILAQNESLYKIGYIQSHEYRKPVASILGLMNVIKEYKYRRNKKCLLMMEQVVKELDKKIGDVVDFTKGSVSNI